MKDVDFIEGSRIYALNRSEKRIRKNGLNTGWVKKKATLEFVKKILAWIRSLDVENWSWQVLFYGPNSKNSRKYEKMAIFEKTTFLRMDIFKKKIDVFIALQLNFCTFHAISEFGPENKSCLKHIFTYLVGFLTQKLHF